MTESEDLLRAIHCQTILTMAVPWDRASMGEFCYILASTMRENNLCYPLGGAGGIPLCYLRALRSRRGVVRLGCEAAVVEIEGGRVKGVTSGEGDFIPADLVVCSSGLKRAIELTGRDHFSPQYLGYTARLRESEAFIAVKFLLGCRIKSARSPCLLYLPDLAPERMFDYLEGAEVPRDLFLFATLPSRWDPSLVPPGRDLLMVGVPAPIRKIRPGLEEEILERAESIAAHIFPEIAGSVEGRRRLYTSDISRFSGRNTGECIGLAQEVGQSGTSRPHPALAVKGLYLVGSDAGGRGIGTECAADSALYLYNLLK